MSHVLSELALTLTALHVAPLSPKLLRRSGSLTQVDDIASQRMVTRWLLRGQHCICFPGRRGKGTKAVFLLAKL